jgi:predicted transglutaminase-like cysteine proteinase
MLIYKDIKDLLAKIQRDGNNRINYDSDQKLYGVIDYWSFPIEINGKLKGDCEDYSMYKYNRLVEEGISSEYLTLIICHTETGEGHAILGVITDEGVKILDNRHSQVISYKSLRAKYEFLFRSTPGEPINTSWQQLA